MGQVSAKDIGDTQQSIGKVGAKVGVITSTVLGVIFILIGIGFCIAAFIPMEISSSTNRPCQYDKDCIGDDTCDHDSGKCMKKETKKKKHYWFLIPGVILIGLAIFIIWFSRWWNTYAQHSRGAAQVGAMGMEAAFLHNILH